MLLRNFKYKDAKNLGSSSTLLKIYTRIKRVFIPSGIRHTSIERFKAQFDFLGFIKLSKSALT